MKHSVISHSQALVSPLNSHRIFLRKKIFLIKSRINSFRHINDVLIDGD